MAGKAAATAISPVRTSAVRTNAVKSLCVQERGRDKTIVLGLSNGDIDKLLQGGIVKIRLAKYGVPDPFGQRCYVLSMDNTMISEYRKNKTLPTEWGRLDCVEETHFLDLRGSGGYIQLPRDKNGIAVVLLGGDGNELMDAMESVLAKQGT